MSRSWASPNRRRRRRPKITVRHADGRVEVVKANHFRQRSRKNGRKKSGSRKHRGLAYHAYLHSEHWRQTRKATLERDKHRCCACGSRYLLQVHHLSYERLGHEQDTDLVTLCDDCHKAHHKGYKIVLQGGATVGGMDAYERDPRTDNGDSTASDESVATPEVETASETIASEGDVS